MHKPVSKKRPPQHESQAARQIKPAVENIGAPQNALSVGTSLRPGYSLSARVDALVASRAMVAEPSQAAHLLLTLQRRYGNGYVQRVVDLARSGNGEHHTDAHVEAEIQRARGGGQPLDPGVRTAVEPAFGTDFSRVCVHTGAHADALSRAVNARAFTTGHDIFFRTGEYAPGSSMGRELLAHELTHVVQQTGRRQAKLAISRPDDVYEQEADRVARTLVNREQHPFSDRAARQSIQRQAAGEQEEDHDLILQAKVDDRTPSVPSAGRGDIAPNVQLQQEREITYVVRAGDTLAWIAAKFGVTVLALEFRNASKLKTWPTRRDNIQGFEAGALVFIPAPTVTAPHGREPGVPGPGGAPESTPEAIPEPASQAPASPESPVPGSPKDPIQVVEYHNRLGTFGRGVTVTVTSTKRDTQHQLEILRKYCKANRAALDKFAEATDWLKSELDWAAFEKCSLSDQKVWLPFFFALFYGGGGPGTKSDSRTLPLVGSPIQATWKGRSANASPHLAGKAMDVKGMDLGMLSSILKTQIHEFQGNGAFPIRSTQIENVQGQKVVHVNFKTAVF